MNNILKSLKYLKNNSERGKFVDGTATTDAVFTGGNVGIGTDNPTDILDITDGSIALHGTNPGIKLYGDINSYYPGIGFYGLNESTSQGSVSLYANSGMIYSSKGAHDFRNMTNGYSMKITANGNIGIDTITPNSKLQVAGAVQVADTVNTCDVDHLGAMKYDDTALTTAGDFMGCVRIAGSDTAGDATDDTFAWKSLTGIVQ